MTIYSEAVVTVANSRSKYVRHRSRLSRCRKTSIFRGKPRSVSCSFARNHISRFFSTACKTQLVSGSTRDKALQQQVNNTSHLTPYAMFQLNITKCHTYINE